MKINQLKDCLAPIIAGHPELRRIVLFGSFARGTQSRRSDIDLLLVMDTDRPFFQRYQGIHGELLTALRPWPVEFFIYTPTEYQHMLSEGNRFLQRAIQEGQVLHEC